MLSVNHRIINRGFSYGIYIFFVECTSSYSVYIREVNLKNVSISHPIKMIRHFVLLSVKIFLRTIYISFPCNPNFFLFSSNAKYVFFFYAIGYIFFSNETRPYTLYIAGTMCIYTLYMCIVHLRPDCLIF